MRKIPLKIILSVAATYLVLTGFLFFIFIFPQNGRIGELKTKLFIPPKSQETEKEREFLILRNDLKKAASSLENKPPVTEESVLARIFDLSKEAGIRALQLEPVNETLYKIIFTGSYPQIAGFIYLLESDRALFQVERLHLENSENLLQGELEMLAYSQK